MVDIARMSGVSIATVSRILNQNGRYSPETEKKVMDIVKEYDYKINQSAKSLRTNKTHSIGVIVPDITNEFFAKIIRSIETYIIPLGYTVFVCDSNENEEMENLHIASLAAKDVDGIIYISGKSTVSRIYETYKIPVVYIDRRPQNAGTLINSDNEMGGFLATEELIRKGCTRIVMLRDKRMLSTVSHRFSGYVSAHNKYEIPMMTELIVETEVNYSDAKAGIMRLIRDGIPFDGIFANNDMMAIGALHALREAGIRIPDDVKIVGFDGISLSEICDPPLTTVLQDTEKFGEISVKALIQKIDKGGAGCDDFIIPVKLAVRNST